MLFLLPVQNGPSEEGIIERAAVAESELLLRAESLTHRAASQPSRQSASVLACRVATLKYIFILLCLKHT
jgi:hypothetical protein